jgi:hypothetical protein
MANLGAAHIGGYMDFINEMLELRNQRLQEEKFKAEQKQEQMQQMMKVASQVSGQIGDAFQGYQESQLGNQLSAQYFGTPPRAQAVDPSLQGPADLAAQRMPGFYTGGMTEFKMRMGMEENLSQARYRDAMINRMGQNLEFQKSKYLVDQATKAKTGADKDLQQELNNSKWYIKENKVYDDAIAKAASPEEYQNAIDAKLALNQAAIKRGMKVEPLDPATIPPYMTADEQTELENQQTAVSTARTALEEAKKAPPGFIDRTRQFLGLGTEPGALGLPGIPTQKEGAIKSAQELYEQEQQRLREMPGASFYGEKPVTSKKTGTLTETPATGDTIPLAPGTKRHSKSTGRTQEWNGKEWVDI